jgi:hypothetical protein
MGGLGGLTRFWLKGGFWWECLKAFLASGRRVPRLHRIARYANDSVPLGMTMLKWDSLREAAIAVVH